LKKVRTTNPSAFPRPDPGQKNQWTCMACGKENNYPDQACSGCRVPEGFEMKKDIDWGKNIWTGDENQKDLDWGKNIWTGDENQDDVPHDTFDFRLQVDLPTFGGLDLNQIAAEGDQIDRNLFYHDEAPEEKAADERFDRTLDKAFGDGWLSDDDILGDKFMGDGWLSDDDDKPDNKDVPQPQSQLETREILFGTLF